MIVNSSKDDNDGTEKLTLWFDEHDPCIVKFILDTDDDRVMYMNIEGMAERCIMPLYIESGQRERAADILATAFQEVGELIIESD